MEQLTSAFKKFFNYHFTILADTYPTKLFRICRNKLLLNGLEGRLLKISQLIGPPKGKSYYGRCNLPGESVFYAALDFHTAIWETKPEPGEYITVSEWKIKEGHKLWTHSIFHPVLSNVSKASKNGYEAWLQLQREMDPKLVQISDDLMTFLTEQYMMPVDYESRENYLFSGIYSSKLIQSKPDGNGFKIEAICYPSVKMEYGLTNLAILNSLVLQKLDLVEVTIFYVCETNYDTSNLIGDDIIYFSPMVAKTRNFDIQNDSILYDHKAELNLAIELDTKYGRR